MKVELGFAKGTQTAKVPEECIISILKPNEVTHELTGEAEVRRSVEHPIASKRLREIAKPGEKIAIITSDVTRPMPSKIVLPVVLDELKAAGISMDDVTVVFALGSHRKQTEEEMRYLAGEAVYDEV